MKHKLSEFECVEMDANELHLTSGGFLLALTLAVGSYMLWNVTANPEASYKAFMNGWNSL
jgi:hypothetical protein